MLNLLRLFVKPKLFLDRDFTTNRTNNAFDPKRFFGVTTLDVMRAKKFIGDFMCINPNKVNIPVIGGNVGITILPLFSHCKPEFRGENEDILKMTHRIQEAGTEVVKAKARKGSARLSMAYAGAHFVNALLRSLNEENNVIECAYVASNVTDLPFFSTPIQLGPEGVKKNLGLPKLKYSEKEALNKLKPELMNNIEKGIKYARNQ